MVATWKLRQALALSGLLSCSVSNGYIYGQMSGMLKALYAKEDGIRLSDEDVSWIETLIILTSILGFALAALFTEKIGRRRAISFFSAHILAAWIMLYFANEMLFFTISAIFLGASFGGNLSLYIICTGEYTSPKFRRLFLVLISSLGPAMGIVSGHILSLFFHWRTVGLIGIIPSFLGSIIPLLSEESPSWLASNGRFDECEKAFKRLQGHGEMELRVLKEIEICKQKRDNGYKIITAWTKKYFWEVLVISSVINVYLIAAGKLVYSMLAVEMLENITESKNVLLLTVLVDGLVVLGAILSCVLIKKLKMRSLLFPAGIVVNILLIFLSAFMFFYPTKDVYYAWVVCLTLVLFLVVINAGCVPLQAYIGEIFPLELKAYCFFLSGIVLITGFFINVRFADELVRILGYNGTFLINASIMTACLVYLWFKLPETKGRTLQEIELYFKNNTFDEVSKVLNGEEVTVLI